MNLRLRKIQKLVSHLFKDDSGEPFLLTEGQAEIVDCILTKQWPRVQVIASTQYGKSSVTAIALILASVDDKQGYAIVAPSQKKSDIIMSKVQQHIFDNDFFVSLLDFKGESIERIKRERSQKRITWKTGGEIEAITADAGNRTKIKDSLTGLGKQNVIEDESALIPDDLHSMVMRMLGGFKNNFLLKIGNPFYRNHFFHTWHSEKYHKIFIDYERAIKEGRYTTDFIDEVKKGLFFEILYSCKFPDEDEFIEGGYRRLINNALLESSFITEDQFKALCVKEITNKKGEKIKVPEGIPILGADFAGMGSDRNSYTIRWGKVMKLLSTNLISDTMQQVPIVEDYIKTYNVDNANVFIDYGGLGQGIGDRLIEREYPITCVMFGGRAPDNFGYEEVQSFKNIRAYMYYELHKWLSSGGKIVYDPSFFELTVVNYKTDSERKFTIQPKDELKKKMKEAGMQVTSPDVADSSALTFAGPKHEVTDKDFEFI